MKPTGSTPETLKATITPRLRRPLPWWARTGLLLVMCIASGILGAAIATRIIYSNLEYYRNHADALPADVVPTLQKRLSLTDKQTEQVKAIIANRHPRMIEHRRQGAQAMLNEFQLIEDEIASVLDSEQEQAWRAIARFVRQRFLPPAPGSQD